MRLTTILLITGFLQVSATTFAQKISLTEKDASLTTVLNRIKAQTGYDFFYESVNIRELKTINIQARNEELKDLLARILNPQNLDFEIDDNSIIIKRRRSPSPLNKPVVPININSFSGVVRDTAGKEIAGATVKLSPGKLTEITNQTGTFVFKNVPYGNYTLSVTSIGYQSLEMAIEINASTEASLLVLVMKEAVLALSSVTINTGYQRIKPEQSTGAVAQITTREYESRISTNFLDGLANRLPGLMINNDVNFTSTDANGNTTSKSLFNIRGISTMSANQNPLIVVDGYPTTLTLDMINPNEIKSVTILKDAAAATVYGVRASNGVIVIERKQASVGKPQVAFRATVGFTPKENYSRYRWDPDASALIVAYQRDIFATSVDSNTYAGLSTPNWKGVQSPVYYTVAQQAGKIINQAQADETFANLGSYNNTKDYSRLFLQTAATQTYNMNVSGGNANALYYITANYTDNLQQQKNNNNNNILLSARSTLKFSQRLSLELTTDFQELRATAAPVPDINSIYPYERLQDKYGNPSPVAFKSGVNPYYNSVLMDMGLRDYQYYPLVDIDHISDKTHTLNNRVTANFDYRIGHGFNLTFGGIYETSRTDQRHYADEQSSEVHQYVDNYATRNANGSLVFNIPIGGYLQQQTAKSSSYTLRTQLNYNKYFGKDHSINAILGAEVRNEKDQIANAAYFGYDDQSLLQQPVNYDILTSGFISPFLGTGPLAYSHLFGQTYREDRYLSGFSNIVYSFRNTYSLTGSLRIDQSNLFGTNPKYRYKPLWSVGAAWNIDKENFMQDVTWVKQLKLRLANGFNGNVAKLSLPQAIGQSYLTTGTVPASAALRSYSLANSGLRWEQTNNFNAGLDYSIFKNIYGSVDWYNKHSTDLVANGLIDPTAGANSSIINTATINNKGVEISLRADWLSIPKFNWNTGFVLALNTSKVQKTYQTTAGNFVDVNNSYGYIAGYPVGALFAYRDAGLDNKGYVQVKDHQGNVYTYESATVADRNYRDPNYMAYVGSSVPAVNAGMSNRFDIGNFYFFCMINYYGGFKVRVPRPSPGDVRPLPGAGSYWKQPGDEQHTDVISLAASRTQWTNVVYNNLDSYVVDGDYITLADLTASYTFSNNKFFKKVGFSHFEIKLQASNLYTVGFNKYNYSMATRNYYKPYVTPTYTIGLFTNF
ncbi:SusC/RagA family TonB-linked outer membrane protein [Sphingobacterium nematocida]|nr:SusC/RagA family TonB-linked outer membrane protein [Sphingobacterium nematocida]